MLNELKRPTDRPAELAFRSLIRCFGAARRVMHPYFGRHGISESQWGVLRLLSRSEAQGEELCLGDLGQRLLVRPPSVTGVVARLEKLGLVSRSEGEKDQRVKRVCLTSRGRELVNRVLEGHPRQLQTVMSALSTQEQQQFTEFCDRLSSHLASMAGKNEERA